MANTIIGVYDDYADAHSALDELLQSGFERSDVRLSPADQSPAAREAALRSNDLGNEESTGGWSIGNFFRALFGNDEQSDPHADVYKEAVRRGSYVLTVDADGEKERDRASDIMNRYHPVDIDTRSARWKSQGWSRYDAGAPMLSDNEAGKREAGRGSVRVLEHGGHVKAERGPVYQPVKASGMNAKENSNAVRETDGQSAIGKNMRPADIEAQQGTTQAGAKPQHMGMDDTDFRTHWQTSYAHMGGRYEDYAPAYRYGTALAGSERFRGSRWNDVEPQVRSDWESSHAGHPWEKAKDAVRFGWEKITK